MTVFCNIRLLSSDIRAKGLRSFAQQGLLIDEPWSVKFEIDAMKHSLLLTHHNYLKNNDITSSAQNLSKAMNPLESLNKREFAHGLST